MSERQYPRKAWVLKPSFKPVEITINRKYGGLGSYRDWDIAEGGKHYQVSTMFQTMAEAIAYGRAQVVKTQADLDKRQANLSKRIAALDKAEGK